MAHERKNFKYKSEWRKAQEEEGPRPEWPIMLLTGFTIIFFKFIAANVLDPVDATPSASFYEVGKYALGFFTAAGINVLGHRMVRAEGIKARFAGVGITIFSFAAFIILVGVLILPNGGTL